MSSHQKQHNLENSGETSLKDKCKCQSRIIYPAKKYISSQMWNIFQNAKAAQMKSWDDLEINREIILEYPRGPKVIRRVFVRKRKAVEWKCQTDALWESLDQILLNWTCTMTRVCQPIEHGKDKEIDHSLELPKEAQAC